MSSGDVRKGITQAKFNEEAANLIYGEIALVSIVGGLYFQSWYVFGGLFIGLIFGFLIRGLNIILAITFSILWSLIAAVVVDAFVRDDSIDIEKMEWWELIIQFYSTSASQVIGGLVLLSSLGWHFASVEWSRDLVDSKDRNI